MTSSASPDFLPEDVLLLVFGLLDPASLSAVARVCRRWRRIVRTKTLWRRVRLPFVAKQSLRSFISRRLDSECRDLTITGCCVVPQATSHLPGIKSSVTRKCILTSTVLELLHARAPNLDRLEINKDNLALSVEVTLRDLVVLNLTSLALTDCYVAREWFLGSFTLSPSTNGGLTPSTTPSLASLDLSGSNRFDDFFLCHDCDVAAERVIRLERQYGAVAADTASPVHSTRQSHSRQDPQDNIPTTYLPEASLMFLLKFPNLVTLKLNRLYRLTGRGIKMLTSIFKDGDKRVSLRGQLRHLEISESKLGDEPIGYLKSLHDLERLVLDGSQSPKSPSTPAALEHLAEMTQLKSISINNFINTNYIGETLGVEKADQVMDRLLFRIFHNLKNLEKLSIAGVFITNPPFSVMSMSWPFMVEHMPKLKSISYCERRHYLIINRLVPVDHSFRCSICDII